MTLRAMLNRSAKATAPMIIEDDDNDFKSATGAKGKSKRKRNKKQVIKDSDSEDETPSTKKTKTTVATPKTTPKSSSSKSRTPGKSPSSSKLAKKAKPSSSKNTLRNVSIMNYFGQQPIKRSNKLQTNSGSKPRQDTPKNIRDDSSSRDVIPETPPLKDEEEEFDSAALAMIEQEVAMESAKEKEQQIHEDEDFSRTLTEAEGVSSTTASSEGGQEDLLYKRPAKKLKLMMEKVDSPRSSPRKPKTLTPSKEAADSPSKRRTPSKLDVNVSPFKMTPPSKGVRHSPRLKEAASRLVSSSADPPPPSSSSSSVAQTSLFKFSTPPEKKIPGKATPTKAKSTPKATPTKSTPKATPTKSTPKATPAKSTPKATPTKSTPKATPTKSTPKATPTKAKISLLEGGAPSEYCQSPLKFARKAITSSKRAIQYLDDDDNDTPPKVSRRGSSSVSHVSDSPTSPAASALPVSPVLVSSDETSPVKKEKASDNLNHQSSVTPIRPVGQIQGGSVTHSRPVGQNKSNSVTPARSVGQNKGSSVTPAHPVGQNKGSSVTPARPVGQNKGSSVTPARPVWQTQGSSGQSRGNSVIPGGTASQDRGRSTTPRSSSLPASDIPKVTRADSYIKYLNRSGPKNLGSKEVPEGAVNCLEGLTFVVTGVLDSLERDEATELIKKYGGKVTTSVSSRTSFLVTGEEAGDGKLAKAEKFGTKKIDEDGLLKLIQTRPTPSGKGAKKQNSKKKPVASKREASHIPVESFSVSKKARGVSHSKTDLESSGVSITTNSDRSTNVRTKEKTQDCLLWVDKYKPLTMKGIVGQKGENSNANKLSRWLQNWEKNNSSSGGSAKIKRPPWGAKDKDGASFKAALLSGPPGVGKTTTAQLVCKENGYKFVEMNASSCRNKSTLRNEVSGQINSLSITAFMGSAREDTESGRRHALIMDEVDGMSGNADRGGLSELISLIKASSIPIICICNDRQKMQIRSLANHCFDLAFHRPKVEQIRGAMMSVCFKEHIKIDPRALNEIIMASGQDMRQVLNNLTLWTASDEPDTPLKLDVAMEAVKNAKKHIKMNPFNVIRMVFDPCVEGKEISLMEKSDLFFHNYSLASLFVQENYIRAKPANVQNGSIQHLRSLALAADSLCQGDLVERYIRKDSRWGLLPLQAFLSSVIPGECMKGFLGRPMFPQWLGMHSKTSRSDRLLQDLQKHTRLVTSCNKTEFGMEYLPILTPKLTQPLVSKGSEGVSDVVTTMNYYDLDREDWDSLVELAHYTGRPELTSNIPSQVKSAFTRGFNKTQHMSRHTSSSTGGGSKRKAPPPSDSQDTYEDDNDEDIVESEEEESPSAKIRKDSGIKVIRQNPKGKGKNGGGGGSSSHSREQGKKKGKKK